MATPGNSFDIVNKVNLPELENAVNQARKEIDNRFDFKGTGSRIECSNNRLALFSSDYFHLKSLADVLNTRLVRRGVSLKAIQWSPTANGPKGTVKQEAVVVQGIDGDKAREITKFIKKMNKKVNVAIQQDQVRVSGKSKDALQEIMKALREHDFDIPLQFTNYR